MKFYPKLLKKNKISSKGFTMVELLIVVAIIGILSAIGIPVVNGVLERAKEKSAQSGLNAIYLEEEAFKSINKEYYIATGSCGDQTNIINNILFSGNITLENKNYRYCIQGNISSYTANAYSKSGGNDYWIKNTNEKNF